MTMKRLLQLSIAWCALMAWLMPLNAAASNVSGDVNNDGEVNIADVNLLIDMILEGDSSPIADINYDMEVNIADVNTLISIILGGSAPTPPGVVETFTVNGVTFKMVNVEGGIYMMGATDDDPEASEDEKPAHQVTLSSYSIGQTEVTQALWVAVMGSNPSYEQDDPNLPVAHISWDDCQTFITKLNQMTGRKFRLPTEAEWEFAARGGNKSKGYKYSGSNDINKVAWWDGNACNGVGYGNPDYGTHVVATKMANELGLYDMTGNVYEWCYDIHSGYREYAQFNPTGPATNSNYRVIRGGSWNIAAQFSRVTDRHNTVNFDAPHDVGLRLALDDKETFNVNRVLFRMVKVEGGTFTMGATPEQGVYAEDNEKPAHQVTLSSYYIGETEVTQALWEEVMGSNPSYFETGVDLPVENVSWEDCQVFITKLNQMTGKNFRLPTEAEWEYAARGGNKSKGYSFAGGNSYSDVAWWKGNSDETSHTIGTRLPNELELYDMSGNVWEWCQDWYGDYSDQAQNNPTGPATGYNRIIRGGCWSLWFGWCRVSARANYSPSYKYNDMGLRLAL